MLDPAKYDAAQLAAIRSTAERTLVLSGAGSGKSRTIIGRIQHLVDSGVKPHQIIAITFTVASGKVLIDRLGYKIGYCGNLHAWLLQLLNRHANLIGFGSGIGVIDQPASERILFQIRGAQRYRGTEIELAKELTQWHGPILHPTAAQNVVGAYRRRLHDSNTVDFAGILHYGKELIVKIRDFFPSDWSFTDLLTDETQDASNDHMDIYEAMPVRRWFACGDNFQRIFGFIGACDRFEQMSKL
jgi:DNA helicase-2/ATP-dependent DNA helicase PcrA